MRDVTKHHLLIEAARLGKTDLELGYAFSDSLDIASAFSSRCVGKRG